MKNRKLEKESQRGGKMKGRREAKRQRERERKTRKERGIRRGSQGNRVKGNRGSEKR